MREDYLWDRSGPPDPEVERLEKLLAPLGHRGTAVAPARKPWRAMAAAAAVVLAAASLWRFQAAPGAETGWQVARLDGSAQVGNRSAEVSMGLRAGQVLRTAKDSTLMLEDDALGRVDLGPESEMRATSNRQLQLQSRKAARVHLGAGAAVRGGYALGARRRSGLRVHDRRESGAATDC